MKIVGVTGLGGLWALKWAWHLGRFVGVRVGVAGLALKLWEPQFCFGVCGR